MNTESLTAPLAAVVNRKMKAAGLSTLKVSEETGIPRITLRRRLAAHRGFTLEEVGAIARVLHTTTTALVAEAEAGDSPADDLVA